MIVCEKNKRKLKASDWVIGTVLGLTDVRKKIGRQYQDPFEEATYCEYRNVSGENQYTVFTLGNRFIKIRGRIKK